MNKRYTTIEQSKELIELGLIYTSDMSWVSNGLGKPFVRTISIKGDPEEICGCWSLAALLELLPSATLDSSDDHHYRMYCCNQFTEWHCTAVEAAVAMIKRLKELNKQ